MSDVILIINNKMQSYLAPESCGMCNSLNITCPLSYQCGHKFCLSCLYPNSNEKQILREKCLICGSVDIKMTNNSPVYYLKNVTDFVRFYEDFVHKRLFKVSFQHISRSVGKYVIIELSTYDATKNFTQNFSYIGEVVYCNNTQTEITLVNCYYLNRDTGQLYPTTPNIANIKVNEHCVFYSE